LAKITNGSCDPLLRAGGRAAGAERPFLDAAGVFFFVGAPLAGDCLAGAFFRGAGRGGWRVV
jgi:hypothetical protein